MAVTAPPRAVGPTVWDDFSLRRSPGRAPVAVGGTLDPATLVGAYRAGAFPWPTGGYDLPWWSPDPRAVIPTRGVRVNRSLRKRLRSCGWTTTVDESFVEVVRGCQRDGTSGWITDELIDGYTRLHTLGWAHSLEVWDADELVGGVYGVGVGGVFAGESMFHTRTDASKVALADFDARFAAAGGVLLDVQMTTDHLVSLGALEIPRADYLTVLARVRDADVRLDRDRRTVARLVPPAG